jgi:aspartate aminotransferase-like enzyme
MSLIRAFPRKPRLPHARPPYLRARDLAKLLPLWPGELADTSPTAHRRLVSRLHAALRHERRKGLAGHWDYDLSRHAALIVAFRAEAAGLHLALKPSRRMVLHTLRRTGTQQTPNASLTVPTLRAQIATTGGNQPC